MSEGNGWQRLDAIAVTVVMRNQRTGEISTLTLNEPTAASIDMESFWKEDDDPMRMFDLLKREESQHKIVLKVELDQRVPEFSKRVSEEMIVAQGQMLGQSGAGVIARTATHLIDLAEKVAKAAKVYRNGA